MIYFVVHLCNEYDLYIVLNLPVCVSILFVSNYNVCVGDIGNIYVIKINIRWIRCS